MIQKFNVNTGAVADETEIEVQSERNGYDRSALPQLTYEDRLSLPLPERVRDTRGKFLSTALFYETIPNHSRYVPIYTLGEKDRPAIGTAPVLPSARRIYLETGDPTEYAAAQALLGSWEHWVHLVNLSWFKPHVEQWRAELRARLKSQAVAIARIVALGEDAPALSAAKWLHAQLSVAPSKGGRPKHRQPERGAEQPTTEDTDLDYARITEQLAEDMDIG